MTTSDGAPLVLVTGATGGIGAAVVARMHGAGWNVGILDRAAESVTTLVDKLEAERPGSTVGWAGSAAEPDDVESWVDKALDCFGSVAGLVNVAGLWHSKPFTELDYDEIDHVLSANLRTAIVCCKVLSKTMVAAGAGSIVNFASTAGEYGSISPAAHYAAAKGAVIALTKSLARELSPLGVRVNAVSPGPVDTSGLMQGSAAGYAEAASRTLVGRLGTPGEIADGVAFLLGSESSFVTGHVLRVNGGSLL